MKTFENTQLIIDEMKQIRFLFCIHTSIRLEIDYIVLCQDSVVKFHRKTSFDDNGLMMRLQTFYFHSFCF